MLKKLRKIVSSINLILPTTNTIALNKYYRALSILQMSLKMTYMKLCRMPFTKIRAFRSINSRKNIVTLIFALSFAVFILKIKHLFYKLDTCLPKKVNELSHKILSKMIKHHI